MRRQRQSQQQQQQQQQPSPNRAALPSDVRRHGFGSPEGMELTGAPLPSQGQQQPQQQQQQPSSQTSPPQEIVSLASKAAPGSPPPAIAATSTDDSTPPPAVTTPDPATAEGDAVSRIAQTAEDADTPAKPRKRRLFLTPSPLRQQQQSQPTPTPPTRPPQPPPPRPSQPTGAPGNAPYTTPQAGPGRTAPSQFVAPAATGGGAGSAGRSSSGPSSRGPRRRFQPASRLVTTTPQAQPSTLSGVVATTPRSRSRQSGAGRNRGFNPLGRLSDIFSPQSPPSFSGASPILPADPAVAASSSEGDYSSASDSDSNSSVKEPFSEQISRLDELLATPAQQLGDLAWTDFGAGAPEDDDLDAEMEDLEASRRLLALELSRADYSLFGGDTGEGTPAMATPGTPQSPVSSSSPERGSSPKKKTKKKKTPRQQRLGHGEASDDWSPLLTSAGAISPQFSPMETGQTQATSPADNSTSPPKSTLGKSGGTISRMLMPGTSARRHYLPFQTPPRQKDSKAPSENIGSSPSDSDVGVAQARIPSVQEEEDSKPSALKSPPQTAVVEQTNIDPHLSSAPLSPYASVGLGRTPALSATTPPDNSSSAPESTLGTNVGTTSRTMISGKSAKKNYSPFQTPPRKKDSKAPSENIMPSPSDSDVGETQARVPSFQEEDEDLKPSALKSPPQRAVVEETKADPQLSSAPLSPYAFSGLRTPEFSGSIPVVTEETQASIPIQQSDVLTGAVQEGEKTPDRGTLPSASPSSPFDPFGFGQSPDSSTPGMALPRETPEVALTPADALSSSSGTDRPGSESGTSSSGMGAVTGIAPRGNIFESIASFAERLVDGGRSNLIEPTPGLTSRMLPERDQSALLLQELDSILTPPDHRPRVEREQYLPAVTPDDRPIPPSRGTAGGQAITRYPNESTLLTLQGSSFVLSQPQNIPSDEPGPSTPRNVDRQRIPSLLDESSARADRKGHKNPRPSDVFGDVTESTPFEEQRDRPVPSLAISDSAQPMTFRTAGHEAPASMEISQHFEKDDQTASTAVAVLAAGGTMALLPPSSQSQSQSNRPSQGTEHSSAMRHPSHETFSDVKHPQQQQGSQIEKYGEKESGIEMVDENPMELPAAPIVSSTTSRSSNSRLQIEGVLSHEVQASQPGQPTREREGGGTTRAAASPFVAPPPTSASTISLIMDPSDELQEDISQSTSDTFRTSVRLDHSKESSVLPEESEEEEFRSGTDAPARVRWDTQDPPERADLDYELEPSKLPTSYDTADTPGTVPEKSYSADSNQVEGQTSNRTNIFLTIALIVCILVLGIGIWAVITAIRRDGLTPAPSPAPTKSTPTAPPLSSSPTGGTGSPSFEPTAIPTAWPNGAISFAVPYRIFILNGGVQLVPESDYFPGLIASMDRLTNDIILNVENGSTTYRGGLRRRLTSVLLPTTIVEARNITCPDGAATQTNLCQELTAEITLLAAEDTWRQFKATTELAIGIGRLQFHLNKVDPTSPAEVIDAVWIEPTPTPVLAPTSLFPPSSVAPSAATSVSIEPSQSNISSFPSDMPSILPSMQPTILRTVAPFSSPSLLSTTSPSRSLETQLPSWSPNFLPSAMLSSVPSTIRSDSPGYVPSSFPSAFSLLGFLANNSFDGGRALEVSSSPQYMAYTWLLQNEFLEEYTYERILQRYALATLYYSTNGTQWLVDDLWLTNRTECVWYTTAGSKASCNDNEELVNLELDSNNLKGSLPPELGLLSSSLERMTLRGGTVDFLSGSIPSELGFLSKLQVFHVQSNTLSGTIPPEIGGWESLQELDLSRNDLRGQLPTQIGSLLQLTSLDISHNAISGSLPTELGGLRRCVELIFEDNRFLSRIPTELGNLRKVEILRGGLNVLTSLPTELGKLTSAIALSFQRCDLQGTIPTEFGQLPRLSLLELDHNTLTGEIPSELGKLSGLRDALALSNNRLSGPLPSELGKLVGLRGLTLDQNLLTGQVPSEISQLSMLTSIRLDGNDLTGSIPTAVCEVFNTTEPAFRADCDEFVDNCPCCTTCCVDGEDCVCRYMGTPREVLCYQQRSS